MTSILTEDEINGIADKHEAALGGVWPHEFAEAIIDATSPDVVLALLDENERLQSLVRKLHAAKGRYHTQLACCDLFDAVGLKNERPVK